MREKVPIHATVTAKLRRMIRSGRVGVGQALPTEFELCAMFECSRGTVRRALDTLVNEGLVRRKQGSGHYVARDSHTKREALLGLIIPNVLNAEILRLTQLFTLESSGRGYRVVLCVTSGEVDVEREFLQEVRRLRVSGVLKFPTLPHEPGFEQEVQTQLRALNLPHVIINDYWTDVRRHNHVCVDESVAIDMAVDHLIGLGHERIGWADGFYTPRERGLACLRHAMARHKLSVPDEYVLLNPPYDAPPVTELWGDGMEGPTAIITPYDGIAVRLIEALPHIGLHVPDDISIVNLNGPPLYTNSVQELTTAVPPNEEIVARALQILLSGSDEAVCHFMLPPTFHIGRTTGPVKGTEAVIDRCAMQDSTKPASRTRLRGQQVVKALHPKDSKTSVNT